MLRYTGTNKSHYLCCDTPNITNCQSGTTSPVKALPSRRAGSNLWVPLICPPCSPPWGRPLSCMGVHLLCVTAAIPVIPCSLYNPLCLGAGMSWLNREPGWSHLMSFGGDKAHRSALVVCGSLSCPSSLSPSPWNQPQPHPNNVMNIPSLMNFKSFNDSS